MYKIRIRVLIYDIRFWLILFFVIRLIGITNAPLEVGHNWRQSLTNMIARNFLENRANILYPTIDMAGEKTGIIGSEFPLFNYIIYLVSYLFDYSHWYGRLINLLVSTIGIFYFYKLVEKILDKKVGFNAAIILSTSIWFAFSRKIMPDTFSISMMIMGLYFGYSYLKEGKSNRLFLFFILCTLGMLCKIPALSLFGVVSIVIFIKEIPKLQKTMFVVSSLGSVSIVFWWYFYWVPYLVDTFQYQLYFTKGLTEGIKEILPLIPEYLDKFYFSSLHSHIGFFCFGVGVFMLVKRGHSILKWSLLLITSIFILFTFKTGSVFPMHNYYIIPYVPVIALVGGYFLTQIPVKIAYIVLALIGIEGIANQHHDFFVNENQRYKLDLERTTETFIPRKDLIVINGGPSPQQIYFAHRKGWTATNEELSKLGFLDSLINLGAKYLVIDKGGLNSEYTQNEEIFSDQHYSIYKLNQFK